MEKKQIGLIIVKGIPESFLTSHSSKFFALNSMISKGNVTKLLRRKDADFLISILGLARVEATTKPVEQTNLEDLYYNVNINSEYKNLFNGMNPFILTNDSQSTKFFNKYKITNKLTELTPKTFEALEIKDYSPLIVYLNCEQLEPESALTLLDDLIQYFSSASRLYTILYPFKSSLQNITPPDISPYVSMVRPEQTYNFYKSDKITDICEEEVAIAIEQGNDCRMDKVQSLNDIFSNTQAPGGLWMLAEQFMRQIAFYLSYIGKFGA